MRIDIVENIICFGDTSDIGVEGGFGCGYGGSDVGDVMLGW